jgi:hypothetical protein
VQDGVGLSKVLLQRFDRFGRRQNSQVDLALLSFALHFFHLRQRGANFIGPEKGMLACDYEEIGRLWPVDEIVAKALEYKKH